MYKLERKSYDNIVETVKLFNEFFPDTVWHGQSFAVSLAGAGICQGMINLDSSIMQDIKFIPAIFLVGSACYARLAYKSFKKERQRLHELAEQRDLERKNKYVNKQEDLKKQGFMTAVQVSDFEIQKMRDNGDKVVDLQTYRDIFEDQDVNESHKRLSLNKKNY